MEKEKLRTGAGIVKRKLTGDTSKPKEIQKKNSGRWRKNKKGG